MSLTSDRLKEILDYDPDTGLFTWKKHGKNKCYGEVAGNIDQRSGRRYIGVDYGKYLSSRLAWLYMHGSWPKGHIDHIDRDTSNDRIANLRDCNRNQNMANTAITKRNTSGYKGVTWHAAKNKWQAQLKHNRKMYYLGLYEDPQEAHEAYQKKAREIFGEFARFG